VQIQPPLELFPPPTLGQVGTEQRNGGLERRTAEKPGIVVARLMAIWAIDAPSKAVGKMAEWKWVARVQLHLKVRLPAVGGERPLADNETHNVANIELPHGPILKRCSTVEQSHVARSPSLRRAMSHVAHTRRARYGELFSYHDQEWGLRVTRVARIPIAR